MMGLCLLVHDGIRPLTRRLLVAASVAALGCSALPQAAIGQSRLPAGSVSQPVVQALPSRNSLTLNQALARLGRNPRDIDALIDAGNAALAMGDVEASVGFFRRADQIAPGNARVKAGLAGALVHSENPYDAIPMFQEAERAGAGEGVLAGERGLAYDLVGDNENAQRYYKAALAKGSDDEIIRRLALSYAMAGDKRAAETTLTPLLHRQDKGAWRTRAFSLAILGQVDEAVSIANATLPASLAASISPYLRYMPRLTRAQQAAAANLGHFPRASEIGRDDPRVAQYASSTPRGSASQQASADAALTPRGQPLGRRETAHEKQRDTAKSQRSRTRRSDTTLAASTSARSPLANSTNATSWRSAASTGTASTRPAAAPATVTPAPSGRDQAAISQPARTAMPPAATLPAASPSPSPSASASPAMPAPGPSLSISSPAVQGPPAPAEDPPVGTSSALATAPAPTPATLSTTQAPAAPPPKLDLAQAFADFLRPKIDVAPAAGAVDVRRLTPSRESSETRPTQVAKTKPAAKPAKPPPPSHPSRIWVQVATGRDKAALAFDWRRMMREDAQALRGKKAFISAWGRTNRLLTGPFPTEAAAKDFLAQAHRAGLDGSFLWTSPAGQVVDPIATK